MDHRSRAEYGHEKAFVAPDVGFCFTSSNDSTATSNEVKSLNAEVEVAKIVHQTKFLRNRKSTGGGSPSNGRGVEDLTDCTTSHHAEKLKFPYERYFATFHLHLRQAELYAKIPELLFSSGDGSKEEVACDLSSFSHLWCTHLKSLVTEDLNGNVSEGTDRNTESRRSSLKELTREPFMVRPLFVLRLDGRTVYRSKVETLSPSESTEIRSSTGWVPIGTARWNERSLFFLEDPYSTLTFQLRDKDTIGVTATAYSSQLVHSETWALSQFPQEKRLTLRLSAQFLLPPVILPEVAAVTDPTIPGKEEQLRKLAELQPPTDIRLDCTFDISVQKRGRWSEFAALVDPPSNIPSKTSQVYEEEGREAEAVMTLYAVSLDTQFLLRLISQLPLFTFLLNQRSYENPYIIAMSLLVFTFLSAFPRFLLFGLFLFLTLTLLSARTLLSSQRMLPSPSKDDLMQDIGGGFVRGDTVAFLVKRGSSSNLTMFLLSLSEFLKPFRVVIRTCSECLAWSSPRWSFGVAVSLSLMTLAAGLSPNSLVSLLGFLALISALYFCIGDLPVCRSIAHSVRVLFVLFIFTLQRRRWKQSSALLKNE